MKIKNLSTEIKIGLFFSLIPLLAWFADFFIYCKGGENFGEGCGFLLIMASYPFFFLVLPITSLISYPVMLIANFPLVWFILYAFVSMVVYFLIGLLATKIIKLFINKIKTQQKNENDK